MNTAVPRFKLVVITGLTAVLFFLALIPFETIPEIPVDIDQKPFFIPLLMVALLPRGIPAFAIGAGAALGEGVRDLIEGYEVDDPFGFVGYILAFGIAGWIIAERPLSKWRLVLAGLFAGAFQAVFEAGALILIDSEAAGVALLSLIGNTLTHGLLWGVLPLLVAVPRIYGRIEGLLGFAPAHLRSQVATPPRSPRVPLRTVEVPAAQAVLEFDDFSFLHPGATDHALTHLSFRVRRGDRLAVIGPSGAGKTTLAMALCGLVPDVTGGTTWGSVRVGDLDPRTADAEATSRKVAMVFQDPAAQIAALTPREEVMAPLLHRGLPGDEAASRALELLGRVGLPTGSEHRRMWELSDGEQQRVAIAAALALEPEVLVLDGVVATLDTEGLVVLDRLLAEMSGRCTTVLLDDDPERVVGRADTAVVLADGHLVAQGPLEQVLDDDEVLGRARLQRPLALALARALGVDEAPLSMAELGTRLDGQADALREQLRTHAVDRAPSRAGAQVLSSEGVTYAHPDGTRALSGVDLRLRAGEVHAVVGPNGAGKTTLAAILAGTARPAEGRVLLLGEDIAQIKASEAAQSVGLVLRNPDEQITQETVLAEVALPLRRRGRTREQAEGRARELLGQVGACEPDDAELLGADPRLADLTTRKLVTIAAALALDPAVLVLDEPNAALDPAGRTLLQHVLDGLREQGTAVLLLEHDVELVARTADQVTVLQRDGRTGDSGPAHEVLTRRDRPDAAGLRPPRAAEAAALLGVGTVREDELLTLTGRR